MRDRTCRENKKRKYERKTLCGGGAKDRRARSYNNIIYIYILYVRIYSYTQYAIWISNRWLVRLRRGCLYTYIWPLNDAFCVLCENSHIHTVCRRRNNLLNLSGAHTRTRGILDEGKVRRRHALGVDTFNRIAFRLRTPSAFVCVRIGHFFLFLLLFFLYIRADAIFYRPTHYAQASGAICPVARSAADPFNNVPGCRCQFPTLFNKPSAGTVS